MPALRNPKHEVYAQELAAGKSQLDAYQTAGYALASKTSGNPAKLASDPRIVARVAEILAEREEIHRRSVERAIEKTAINKEWVISHLVEITSRCMADKVFTNPETGEPITAETADGEMAVIGSFKAKEATRAIELLGKELGMFIDRKEVKRVDEFENMGEAELRAYIVEGLGLAAKVRGTRH